MFDPVFSGSAIDTTSSEGRVPLARRDLGLSKIEESSSHDHSRKRSSSLTECPPHRLRVSHRNSRPNRSKPGQTGITTSEQNLTNLQKSYPTRTSSQSDVIDEDKPVQITKSQSAQDLQPPKFETNQNIQLQYSQTRVGQTYPQTTVKRETSSEFPSILSQPDLYPTQIAKTNYHPEPGDPSTFYPLSPEPRDPSYHPAYGSYYYPQTNMGVHPQVLDPSDYEDITMEWIPSLGEYSSRASICETSSVTSRKEVKI